MLTSPLLSARGIHLSLQGKPILNGIDLDLYPGAIHGLIGPNGAGKSCLLRILTGEWQPDAGSVSLEGAPLALFTPRKLGQRRACLQQSPNLDFAFSVMEVVLLGRSPHMQQGSEQPEDYQIAEAALTAVDLLDRRNDLYTTLSGGEKQRVHLARALAQIHPAPGSPSNLLFLDEPTNNLDLAHQFAVFDVARAAACAGTAVCIILHDLNHALNFCDALTVLDHGQRALHGKPDEVLLNPAIERIFSVQINRLEANAQPTLQIRKGRCAHSTA